MSRFRFGFLISMSLITLWAFAAKASAQGGTLADKTKVAPSEPCCSITAINPATGIVTAKTITGKTFQFRVGNFQPVDGFAAKTGIGPIDGFAPAGGFGSLNPVGPVDGIGPVVGAGPVDAAKFLSALSLGQKVWANLAGQVSVNRQSPCCTIIIGAH